MSKMQFTFSIFSKVPLRFIGFIATLLLSYNCNTTEPPNPPNIPPKSIKLNLVDVSCTEAFIKISAPDTVLPVYITLKRDNATLFSLTLTKTDTVVIDTMLQPNITYTYHTAAQVNGREETSDTIRVKTLNTTSHNFTWQTFTFGEPSAGSSVLNDVAIINENDIWAVGEIYKLDSLGQPDPLPYNAVHWNGSKWDVKRISVEHNGNIITPPLYGIFAYTSADIWLSSGVPVHGDGINWKQYHLFDLGILGQNDGYLTKIWGKSSDDLYYVGTLGTIARYQNGIWSRMESGTTTSLNDVWGYQENENSRKSVLIVASNVFHTGEYKLLTISGNSATDTLNWSYNDWLTGVWFLNRYSPIYICGDGVKVYKNNQWSEINLPNYFTEAIRGDSYNNLVVVGHFGFAAHFNGLSWQTLNELAGQGRFTGVAVKGGTVVISGNNSSGGIIGKAVIIVGYQ